jgi:hypothetical protein
LNDILGEIQNLLNAQEEQLSNQVKDSLKDLAGQHETDPSHIEGTYDVLINRLNEALSAFPPETESPSSTSDATALIPAGAGTGGTGAAGVSQGTIVGAIAAAVGIGIIAILLISFNSDDGNESINIPLEENGIEVYTEKSAYDLGETVRIYGVVNKLLKDLPITLDITDSDGKIYFSTMFIPNTDRGYEYEMTSRDYQLVSGNFSISVSYGNAHSAADFVVTGHLGQPILISPNNRDSINVTNLVFSWTRISSRDDITYDLNVYRQPENNLILSENNLSSTSYTVKAPLTAGTYTWFVYAKDAIGTIGPESSKWSFTISDTNPKIELHTDKEKYQIGEPILVSGQLDKIRTEKNLVLRIFTPSGPMYGEENIDLTKGPTFSAKLNGLDQIGQWELEAIYEGRTQSSLNFELIDLKKSAIKVTVNKEELYMHDSFMITAKPMFLKGDNLLYVKVFNPDGLLFSEGQAVESKTGEHYFNATMEGELAVPGKFKVEVEDWNTTETIYLKLLKTQTPASPILISPTDNAYVNSSLPIFEWSMVYPNPGALFNRYMVQIFDENKIVLSTMKLNSTLYRSTGQFLDGEYTWQVITIDDTGQKGNWSSKFTFRIDTSPPSGVSLLSPPSNEYLNSTIVHFDWSDASDRFPVSYVMKIWGEQTNLTLADITTSNLTLKNVLPEGKYYWQVYGVDAANNRGFESKFKSFVIDTTPPKSVTLVSPANGTNSVSPRPTFTWNPVSDPSGTMYEIAIFGGDNFTKQIIFQNGLSTGSFTPIQYFQPGTYQWYVSAYDGAGNKSKSDKRFTFIIADVE